MWEVLYLRWRSGPWGSVAHPRPGGQRVWLSTWRRILNAVRSKVEWVSRAGSVVGELAAHHPGAGRSGAPVGRLVGHAEADVGVESRRSRDEDRRSALAIGSEDASAVAVTIRTHQPELIGPIGRQRGQVFDREEDLIRGIIDKDLPAH